MRPCRPGRYINQYQQNISMSGASVYHQRAITTAISRAKAYLVQIHVTSAVYLHTTASKWKAKAPLDDSGMSTRAISTAISKAKTIFGSAVYHKRGVSTAISKAKACLRCMSSAIEKYGKSASGRHSVSTSAVYQPQSEKQKHIRRSCISPARYSCISTAIEISSESASGRHSRVDRGGTSTARRYIIINQN